ncbi:MAG TPA: class I SAM-dependent methyltransferase [Burkholderiales bacterium]|nr:class I SAM-dependent methyltransferase [Burkholderiales bacterium]
MSAADMKAREVQSWSSVVPGWRRHDQRLSRAFGAVSTALLDKAGVKTGQHVLDVACGTGEPAIPAAQRVGPAGKVHATDIVAGMVEFAKEKAAAQGLRNIEFVVTDGEQLDLPAAAFDAATMRWGIMFMPDPAACLQRIHRALKPGASFATATWAGPDRNPWAAVPLAVMKRYQEIPAPVPGQTGIFAFADPERLKGALQAAGFRDVVVEGLDVLWAGPSTGGEYFSEVIEMAGPLATLYGKLPGDRRRAYADEVAQEAERQSVRKPGVALPGHTWIASGRK